MGGPPVTRDLLATPKTFAVADIRPRRAGFDTPVDPNDESASTKPDGQGAGAYVSRFTTRFRSWPALVTVSLDSLKYRYIQYFDSDDLEL